jgi:hypothetical protein
MFDCTSNTHIIAHTTALHVWNMANVILRNESIRGVLPSQTLIMPARTTVKDLLDKGFTLRSGEKTWSDEEVRTFFEGCAQFRRAPASIGKYQGVYDWISYSLLKGSKKPPEVRLFAEKVYNGRRRKRRRNKMEHKDPKDVEEHKEEGSDVDEEGEDEVVEEEEDEVEVEEAMMMK